MTTTVGECMCIQAADVRSHGTFDDHVYLCYSIMAKKQMVLMTQAKKQMAQLVLKSGAKKITSSFVMMQTR